MSEAPFLPEHFQRQDERGSYVYNKHSGWARAFQTGILATESALSFEVAHPFGLREESPLQMIRHRLFQNGFSAPLLPFWLALAAITALLSVYGAISADPAWEVEATIWVQSASPHALHQMAKFMTVIGRSPISTVIPAVAIVAMWVWGQRHLSIFLAGTSFACGVCCLPQKVCNFGCFTQRQATA